MFDNLKGIEKEREEKERHDVSAVERLLELGDKYIRANINKAIPKTHEFYNKSYKKLRQELPEFNEQDLKSLIYARANQEYAYKEAKLLGLYTGILLQALTERNKAKGKRTRFHINGQGARFDRLFYHAREIDELIIDSFAGEDICSNIASHQGNANTILLNNIAGEDTALYAGENEGSIGTLIINNNKGDNTAHQIARKKGKIETLIISNCKGNNTAYYLGAPEGNIRTAILQNNQGKETAVAAGEDGGKIKSFIINKNKGDTTALNAGIKGSIDLIIVQNSIGDQIAMNAGSHGKIKTIALHNNKGKNTARGAEAEQIITEPKEYQKISQQYRLEEVFRLIESFKDKTAEEIIATTEQIKKCLNN